MVNTRVGVVHVRALQDSSMAQMAGGAEGGESVLERQSWSTLSQLLLVESARKHGRRADCAAAELQHRLPERQAPSASQCSKQMDLLLQDQSDTLAVTRRLVAQRRAELKQSLPSSNQRWLQNTLGLGDLIPQGARRACSRHRSSDKLYQMLNGLFRSFGNSDKCSEQMDADGDAVAYDENRDEAEDDDMGNAKKMKQDDDDDEAAFAEDEGADADGAVDQSDKDGYRDEEYEFEAEDNEQGETREKADEMRQIRQTRSKQLNRHVFNSGNDPKDMDTSEEAEPKVGRGAQRRSKRNRANVSSSLHDDHAPAGTAHADGDYDTDVSERKSKRRSRSVSTTKNGTQDDNQYATNDSLFSMRVMQSQKCVRGGNLSHAALQEDEEDEHDKHDDNIGAAQEESAKSEEEELERESEDEAGTGEPNKDVQHNDAPPAGASEQKILRYERLSEQAIEADAGTAAKDQAKKDGRKEQRRADGSDNAVQGTQDESSAGGSTAANKGRKRRATALGRTRRRQGGPTDNNSKKQKISSARGMSGSMKQRQQQQDINSRGESQEEEHEYQGDEQQQQTGEGQEHQAGNVGDVGEHEGKDDVNSEEEYAHKSEEEPQQMRESEAEKNSLDEIVSEAKELWAQVQHDMELEQDLMKELNEQESLIKKMEKVTEMRQICEQAQNRVGEDKRSRTFQDARKLDGMLVSLVQAYTRIEREKRGVKGALLLIESHSVKWDVRLFRKQWKELPRHRHEVVVLSCG